MKNTNKELATHSPLVKVLALLIVLLCVSLLFAMPTVAKFTSGNKGISDAQIAAFAANAGSSANTSLLLDRSEKITTANYTFWVTNTENTFTSEITSEYSVILTFPEKLPNGITILVDGLSGSVSADGLTYTFKGSNWTFASGVQETNNHTLTIQADFDVVKEDFTIEEIDICVKIAQTT